MEKKIESDSVHFFMAAAKSGAGLKSVPNDHLVLNYYIRIRK